MTKHYTAHLEVSSTEHTSETSGYGANQKTEHKREVIEVAKLVIRAESLEALSAKLQSHIGLIEEG